MATGILIAESLRDDATLQVASWQLTRIERVTVTNLSEEQRAAGLPSVWTVLHFDWLMPGPKRSRTPSPTS